jgi:hypothetical protein
MNEVAFLIARSQAMKLLEGLCDDAIRWDPDAGRADLCRCVDRPSWDYLLKAASRLVNGGNE